MDLEYLKSILHYDPITGIWTWLKDNYSVKSGDIAGSFNHGYCRIQIDEKKYGSHVLAWFYMTGEWPENLVDHINTNTRDNRWINLRKATSKQNQGNSNKRKDNSTGFKGVSFHKASGKFVAQITINEKRVYLGIRTTPEEAFELYKQSAIEYFGDYCRLA